MISQALLIELPAPALHSLHALNGGGIDSGDSVSLIAIGPSTVTARAESAAMLIFAGDMTAAGTKAIGAFVTSGGPSSCGPMQAGRASR